MKAYCFRSGHVFLGPSVPAGAIELADHDNEADLLWVIGFTTYQLRDAEGCPQTVIPGLLQKMSEFGADLLVTEVIEEFERQLSRIKKNPRYKDHGIPGPITPWPDEPSEKAA